MCPPLQELLAFLLDGLHEDLNRVKTKPPTEVPTGNGNDDVQVAVLAWQRFCLRNDSFVQHLFWGQYKSWLECPDPECGKVSVTFDAFNQITLNLPEATGVGLEVTVRFADSDKRPMRCRVHVRKTGSILDLKRAIGEAAGLDPDHLAIAEVQRDRSSSSVTFVRRSVRMTTLPSRRGVEIFAFELPFKPADPFEQTKTYSEFGTGSTAWSTPSFRPASLATSFGADSHVEAEECGKRKKVIYVTCVPRRESEGGMMGTPFVISLQGVCSCAQLRTVIENAMSRYLHPPTSWKGDQRPSDMDTADGADSVESHQWSKRAFGSQMPVRTTVCDPPWSERARSWSERAFAIHRQTGPFDSEEINSSAGCERISHLDTLELQFSRALQRPP